MSESSRWSGESEIPEKMVWFNQVLDVDENGEITYLEDESRQWKRKEEWYGYEGNEDGSHKYVHIDEKKFKDSDHRELSSPTIIDKSKDTGRGGGRCISKTVLPGDQGEHYHV